MKKIFEKLHSTNTRARYKISFLNSKKIDNYSLAEYFKTRIKEINNVRINKKASCIIFNFSSDITNKIEEILLEIDFKDFNKNHLALNNQDNMLKPSKIGMVKAIGTLTTENFIYNDKTKLLISTLGSFNSLSEATKELFTQGLTSKVLEGTAIAVSLFRKDYLAANSTNAMLELGEYMEETMAYKSDDLIKELSKPNIKETWIEKIIDGKPTEILIKVEDIKVGDIVIVGAGNTIPVDGHIIDGIASVNEVSMTGEAEPVNKKTGNKALSGTIVENGRIKIWAELVGENSATNRIKHYIQNTLKEKSSTQISATKLADKLVPVTLGLAGISYFISKDSERLAAVLQADYSCALKLATPVAFKSVISKVGKNGIMVKGAKTLEALSKVDTFVFDKTGTLTSGELNVKSINSFEKDWNEKDILNLAASAEEHYFHPVAQAIVKAAKEKDFVHFHHKEVEFIVAHGVKTEVDGKKIVIGNRHFLEDDEKINFAPHKEKINKLTNETSAILFIGIDDKLIGCITLSDNLRENTKSTIKRLKSLGIKNIVMLTGDTKEKAEKIAKEIDIDIVKAELLPEDKASIINELKEKGNKVAFVGDGINDAPALISANVGISMSKGADIAKATADVSLLKDDISAIADVKEYSNKTMKLIKNNFNATVGINSIILLGASLGIFSPIKTSILHNGTTIGLLLNSIKGVKLDKKEKN